MTVFARHNSGFEASLLWLIESGALTEVEAERARKLHQQQVVDQSLGMNSSAPTPIDTVAVEMDPLLLLCRLATSVPPPRFHTVKYAGVVAPARQGLRNECGAHAAGVDLAVMGGC